MNFNMIPDSLVIEACKLDVDYELPKESIDEKRKINIYDNTPVIDGEHKKFECNPDILEFELTAVIKNDDLDKVKAFLNNPTDTNISLNRLASAEDYNLVLEAYDDNKDFIDFGIINIEIVHEYIFDNLLHLIFKLSIHTFDSLQTEALFLEDIGDIKILNKDKKYIQIDTLDETKLCEYLI